MLLKTALIGLGKIGAGYAQNSKLALHYPYSTHLQVINDHPDFELGAVYDSQVEHMDGFDVAYQSVEDIAQTYQPDVLVLATPPRGRMEILRHFHGVKAVVIEKPLALDLKDAKEIVQYCDENNIFLHVNYWRRFDEAVIALKKNLWDQVGEPQSIIATYGRGLRNNGVHLIDQIRYLFGSVDRAQALGHPLSSELNPIDGDVDLSFFLELKSGCPVYGQVIDFNCYREVGLDIWGTKGRVEFLQGGLVMRHSVVKDHRALDDVKEIQNDQADFRVTGAGKAFYGLYDHVLQTVQGGGDPLLSDGGSALENEKIIERILASSPSFMGREGS